MNENREIPQSYEDHGGSESVVEQPSNFNGEVKKRKNIRALVFGAMVVVILIVAVGTGAFFLNRFNANSAAETATKEKLEKEKAATGRRGKMFGVRENDTVITEVSAVKPPSGAASSPGSAGIGLTGKGDPPGSPSSGGGSAPRPLPPPKPIPPPMMVSLPATAGEASGTNQSTPAAPGANSQPLSLDNAFGSRSGLFAASGGPSYGGSSSRGPKVVEDQSVVEAAGKTATATSQATASKLGQRSYVIARGSWIPCVLETQLNSTIAGPTSCVIPEDVYSDDGKTLLIDKGSRSQGQFGSTLKNGDQRIAIAWSRIKTTKGIVIDVDSPTADGVGTSGAGGYIDNHWIDRIGAAVLLSFFQDATAYAIAKARNESGNNTGVTSNVNTQNNIPNNSISASNRLAEKILDSTINIAPTLYKNRGDRVMIFVNRDMWFDSTYKLVKG